MTQWHERKKRTDLLDWEDISGRIETERKQKEHLIELKYLVIENC